MSRVCRRRRQRQLRAVSAFVWTKWRCQLLDCQVIRRFRPLTLHHSHRHFNHLLLRFSHFDLFNQDKQLGLMLYRCPLRRQHQFMLSKCNLLRQSLRRTPTDNVHRSTASSCRNSSLCFIALLVHSSLNNIRVDRRSSRIIKRDIGRVLQMLTSLHPPTCSLTSSLSDSATRHPTYSLTDRLDI